MKKKSLLAKILITSIFVTSIFWPGTIYKTVAATKIQELSTPSNADVDMGDNTKNESEITMVKEQLLSTSSDAGRDMEENSEGELKNEEFEESKNLARVDNVVDSGVCGELIWEFMEDGTLQINGTGGIPYYKYEKLSLRPWASYILDISNIIIGDGVTSIGDYAFCKCENLVSVEIPDSIWWIGSGAFYDCRNLTEVKIPNGVDLIGDSAFSWCGNLTEVIIPSSVTCIGHNAFESCDSLTQVIIPDSVTEMGDNVFRWCSNLREIIIPNSVRWLRGMGVFCGCKSLTKVTIPNGEDGIGDYMFDGCSGLREITIPDSVHYIGKEAFSNCDTLTDVYFSGSEEQWKLIEIEDGNSSLANASIHYNARTTISNEHINSMQFGQKAEYAGHFIIECLEDYSGTASWTSSDPTVFNLHGDTSKSFSGLSTQIDIYGDALAVGKATITITTDDGTSDFFEIEVIENGCVMRFDRWDAERQQVYFHDSAGILNTYYVTDQTDLSENISSLIEEYVWVSAEDNGDGHSKNILSMHPVISQLGILSDVTNSAIVVNDISYPVSPALSTSDLAVGKEVVYHIYNNQVVRVQYPYETTGTVTAWSYQDVITIKTGNIANTYITNSLTNKTFLSYIDKILDQDIKALVLDGVILRIGGKLKLLAKNPHSGQCLYEESLNAPALKDIYPVEDREDFKASFTLIGNYKLSNDAVFTLREYDTDKIIAYTKSISDPEFSEALTNEDEACTYFELIFDPILPDNTKLYVAIENGSLINNDTKEEFTMLCEKTDWWFETPELVRGVWGFRNEGDSIDLSIYRLCYQLPKALLHSKSSEKGLCAGMVGTSIDFAQGYIDYTDFTASDSTFGCTEDIQKSSYCQKINRTAHEYIKLSYVLQFEFDLCKRLKHNRNKLKELYEAAKDGQPVYITIHGKIGNKEENHALMGYKLETGNNYSDIKVYDCNLCNLSQRIRLYGTYPNFTSWRYLNHAGRGDDDSFYSKYSEISFDTEYPSAYFLATYVSGQNRAVKVRNDEGESLLATDLDDFEIIDSFGNIVSKRQAYSLNQDILTPIAIASSPDNKNDGADMYWIEPGMILKTTNRENTSKKIYFASDVQMFEMDVPSGDVLSISTDNTDKTMDIQLEHQSDSEITISYNYVINDEIATIQITGSPSGLVAINGKKDSADINNFNINSVNVSYNGQELEKELNLPSGVKVNISLEQAVDNTYLKIMYDTDNDGYSDSDLVPPIPFNPVNEEPQIVPVTFVDIEIPERKIRVGDTIQLKAIIQPDNATDKSVVWISSDETIATVLPDGVVTAIKAGIVNITVRSTNSSFEKTITIEVQDMPGESGTEGNKPGEGTSTGNKNRSGNRRSVNQYSGGNIITRDTRKGYVNSLTGIITGEATGYSKWQQDLNGWKLLYADGTYALGVNVKDALGEIHEQILWEQINGAWYTFGVDGYAKSGFIYDYQLSGWFYIDINIGMLTGWQLINGKWYYFNTVSDGTKGKMFTDIWVDEYYLNQLGEWEEGKEKFSSV